MDQSQRLLILEELNLREKYFKRDVTMSPIIKVNYVCNQQSARYTIRSIVVPE